MATINLVCALLLCWAAPAWAEQARLASLSALTADDSCAEGGGSECSLSAVQVRRDRAGPSKASRDEVVNRQPPSLLQAHGAAASASRSSSSRFMDCYGWVPTHLPQWTFWAEEVHRRLHLASDGPDRPGPAFETFAKQAAVLACNEDYDPRLRKPGVIEFLREVKRGNGLEVPPLPQPWLHWDSCWCREGGGNLTTKEWDDSVFCYDCTTCHSWVYSDFVELAWWSRKLRGNRTYEGDDLCWDKVKAPDFLEPTNSNFWMSPGFIPWTEDFILGGPEYEFEKCLDIPLEGTMVTQYLCDPARHAMVPKEAMLEVIKDHDKLPVFPTGAKQQISDVVDGLWTQVAAVAQEGFPVPVGSFGA